jgi:hypothetical protein
MTVESSPQPHILFDGDIFKYNTQICDPFPSRFPTKNFCEFIVSYMSYIFSIHLSFPDLITFIIFGEYIYIYPLSN